MEIINIKRGESLTIGFVFPLTYDLSRIIESTVYIDNVVFEKTMTDNVIRCELTSNQTANLQGGTSSIWLALDDEILGVKKLNCGELTVSSTSAESNNDSINEGFDVLINLIINETEISVDNLLYNYLKGTQGIKGDKGDEGRPLTWVDGGNATSIYNEN